MSYRKLFFQKNCIPNFLMVSKIRKKVEGSITTPVGQHKTTSEVISDSAEEFEHLSMEAEDG